ncbi:MAG: hypothetical protein GY847_22395 [Proteobacteria bacterium]|nr:hypothetical protein [Pseudomonadota bacterium]
MPGGVRIIDRGWNAFKKKLQRNKGKGLVASVGVQGDKATEMHADGDITNATIGAIHEYGAEDNKRPPARPHWRPTFDENEKKYAKEMEKIPERILRGQSTIKGELLLVGEKYKADVLKKIQSHIPPRLADETLEQEKHTAPLWATGQYVNSFSVDVVPRSEKSDA